VNRWKEYDPEQRNVGALDGMSGTSNPSSSIADRKAAFLGNQDADRNKTKGKDGTPKLKKETDYIPGRKVRIVQGTDDTPSDAIVIHVYRNGSALVEFQKEFDKNGKKVRKVMQKGADGVFFIPDQELETNIQLDAPKGRDFYDDPEAWKKNPTSATPGPVDHRNMTYAGPTKQSQAEKNMVKNHYSVFKDFERGGMVKVIDDDFNGQKFKDKTGVIFDVYSQTGSIVVKFEDGEKKSFRPQDLKVLLSEETQNETIFRS